MLTAYEGTLRDVDLSGRVGELDVPTLLTYGATTRSAGRRRRAAPIDPGEPPRGILEESSHMPQFEEPAAFARLLYGFVDEHDG